MSKATACTFPCRQAAWKGLSSDSPYTTLCSASTPRDESHSFRTSTPPCSMELKSKSSGVGSGAMTFKMDAHMMRKKT